MSEGVNINDVSSFQWPYPPPQWCVLILTSRMTSAAVRQAGWRTSRGRRHVVPLRCRVQPLRRSASTLWHVPWRRIKSQRYSSNSISSILFLLFCFFNYFSSILFLEAYGAYWNTHLQQYRRITYLHVVTRKNMT